MFEAIAVSRRPWLEASHKAQILALGVKPLYLAHTTGTFADAVNQVLALAETPVVLKVDDHDSYPPDHAAILEAWEPGYLLHGVASFVGCDGQALGNWPSLCASAFPSDIRVKPNRWGQITDSVLAQCKVKQVETGVRKLVCPGDWSWGVKPGSFRGIDCVHR